MTGSMIAMLLAAAATSTSYAGFEPLKPISGKAALCSADAGICILTGEPDVLTVTRGGEEIARWAPEVEGGDSSFAPMPAFLRLKDGRLLIGALATRQTSYSGGGGSATQQLLALIEPDRAPKTVLTLPEHGYLMIRACFSPRDMRRRAGACHDEYRFGGALAVANLTGDTPPALHFRMKASHYPRGVSRYRDSRELPRPRKADLTWQADARCTYQRTYRFDLASDRYVPDAALPDCSDYTDP